MVAGRFAIGVASLGIAGVALWWLTVSGVRRRNARGATAFVAYTALLGTTALALSGYAAVAGEGALAHRPGDLGWWYRLLVVATLLVTVPWTGFALQYTGRDRELGLETRRAILATLPIVGLATTAALLPGRVPVGGRRIVDALAVVGVVALGVYWLLAHLLGTVTLVRTSLAYDHIDATRAVSLTLASSLPLVTIAVVTQLRRGATTPPAPVVVGVAAIGFLGAGIGIALAVYHHELLAGAPAAGNVGRARLVEEMDDPVLVVDADERVVELNDAAERRLRTGDGRDGQLAAAIGLELDDLREASGIGLDTDDGERSFDPLVTPLSDSRGGTIGHAVVLRDVTDREIRRQRLSVLNRVLRHNLRNKLTVAKGVAGMALDGKRPPDSLAESLQTAADELMTLGEKAREIEAVMEADRETTTVDLQRFLSDVATDRRRANPAVPISTSTPAGASVRTDEQLFYCALSNVLEVVGDQSGAEDGIEVQVDPDVGVVVAAEGVAVPEDERSAVEAGEETDLDHARGLALWAAAWCLARIGGELTFGDPEDEAVATLNLSGIDVDPDGGAAGPDRESAAGSESERGPGPGSRAGGGEKHDPPSSDGSGRTRQETTSKPGGNPASSEESIDGSDR